MNMTLKRCTALVLSLLMLSGFFAPALAASVEVEPDEEYVQEDVSEVLPDEEREPETHQDTADPVEEQDSGDETDTGDAPQEEPPVTTEQEEEDSDVITSSLEWVSVSGGEDDNDELFYDYMIQAARDSMSSVAFSRPRFAPIDKLSGPTMKFYSKLVPLIKEVAAGTRNSSKFVISLSDAGIQSTWTAEELGVDTISETDANGKNQVTQAALDALVAKVRPNLNLLNKVLLTTYPYELYWYDKTAGTAMGYSYSYTSASITMSSMTILFYVSRDYAVDNQTRTTDVNTAITSAATAASQEAGRVVDACSGQCDYDKLVYYRNYICDEVEYNHDAANSSTNTPYGNPWQLIWVFDKDSTTKVVCEGYSKAMKYLCDLSHFRHPLECRLISGVTSGPHMWNLVEMMDGKTYLVDLTNYDSTRGSCFFLGGYSRQDSSQQYTYRYGTTSSISYLINDDMYNVYTGTELTPSSSAYTKPTMAQCTITVSDVTSISEAATPDVQVSYRGKSLTADEDYTLDTQVSLENGTGTVTITGNGDFSGSATRSYRVPSSVTLTAEAQDSAGNRIGSVTINPSGVLMENDEVTVTAPELWGWRFQGWYQDETQVSSQQSYTFTITGNTSLAARYARVNVTLTLHAAEGSAYQVNGVSYTGERTVQVPLGGQVALTAADSSRFLRWENESGRVLGSESTLTLTVNGDTDITLVNRAEETCVVTFLSAYGQVLRSESLRAGDRVSLPAPPVKVGCDFTGWTFADGSAATAADIEAQLGQSSEITLQPAYEQWSSAGCSVTVRFDGAEQSDEVHSGLAVGDGLTLTAPALENRTFQMWADDAGNVLGYSNTYFLMVTGDATIHAVYGVDAPQAMPTITLSSLWRTNAGSTKKITGSATRNVPEGFTVLETGMLYTVNQPSLTEEGFQLGGNGVSRYLGSSTSSQGVLYLNVKVSLKSTLISMRGYMLVREDATGCVGYYYSGIQSASLNSLTD